MARYERSDPTTEWLAYIQDGSDGLVLGANVLREQGLEPTRQGAEETEQARAALALDPDAPMQDDASFVLTDPWPFFCDVLRWPDSRVAGVAAGQTCRTTSPCGAGARRASRPRLGNSRQGRQTPTPRHASARP